MQKSRMQKTQNSSKIFKSGFRPGLYKDKNTIKQEKFLFWLMLESHSKINYFAIHEIPDQL